MQTLISSRESIRRVVPAALLIPSKVVAIAASDSIVHPRVIQSLATRTRRGEQVGVVIGHNRFALHTLTRLVHCQGCDPQSLLTRIELSRAFTCYQLHRRVLTLDTDSMPQWRALYVLGLLDTFYDESVRYPEAARLLIESLAQLTRIARTGLPVLITLSFPNKPGREGFVKLVAEGVDEYWKLCAPISPSPPSLQLEIPLLSQSHS